MTTKIMRGGRVKTRADNRQGDRSVHAAEKPNPLPYIGVHDIIINFIIKYTTHEGDNTVSICRI